LRYFIAHRYIHTHTHTRIQALYLSRRPSLFPFLLPSVRPSFISFTPPSPCPPTLPPHTFITPPSTHCGKQEKAAVIISGKLSERKTKTDVAKTKTDDAQSRLGQPSTRAASKSLKYTHSKEPYIRPKEPYKHPNPPSMRPKEPHKKQHTHCTKIVFVTCFCKSPIYARKSPRIQPKRAASNALKGTHPTFIRKSLCDVDLKEPYNTYRVCCSVLQCVAVCCTRHSSERAYVM